jgi:hypothetical protein
MHLSLAWRHGGFRAHARILGLGSREYHKNHKPDERVKKPKSKREKEETKT